MYMFLVNMIEKNIFRPLGTLKKIKERKDSLASLDAQLKEHDQRKTLDTIAKATCHALTLHRNTVQSGMPAHSNDSKSAGHKEDWGKGGVSLGLT